MKGLGNERGHIESIQFGQISLVRVNYLGTVRLRLFFKTSTTQVPLNLTGDYSTHNNKQVTVL